MYSKILLALDPSPAAHRALAKALALTGIHRSKLYAAAVEPGMPWYTAYAYSLQLEGVATLQDDHRRFYADLLAKAQTEAKALQIDLQTRLFDGHRIENILEGARVLQADLLIFGINSDPWLQHFLGTAEHKLAQRVTCDVLGVH